jgi:organic hydroperoxide reductase OsmC/OhrA
MVPALSVHALEPREGRRTLIEWANHSFSVSGDNHIAHGGSGTGPDGFDLLAAALGQCLLNTLLAKAQRDGTEIRAAKAVVATKARLRGPSKAPFLSDFEVDLYLDAEMDETVRVELEEWAKTMCGVSRNPASVAPYRGACASRTG